MVASRCQSTTAAIAAMAGVVGFSVAHFLTTDGNLDWDTYGRMAFMPMYDPHIGGDTHVLYHRVLWWLQELGVSPQRGVFGVTGFFYGTFLVMVDWVGRRRGLSEAQRLLMFALVILCSPGVWTMTWMAEDNIGYLPPVLGYLHLMTCARGTLRQEVLRGIAAGTLLGIALLINITVLIFFVLVPVGLLAWCLGRREEALRSLLTVAVCLTGYYSFHAFAGYGADIALHEYVVKAASLEDFGEDTAPTISWLRLKQFVWGARAMFLTPGINRMELPTNLDNLVRVYLPGVVFVLYAALGAWTLRRRGHREWAVWPLLPASVVGISLVFPYFYEPLLIERWDMFWLCHILGAMALLKSRPRMGMEVLLAFLVLIESAYTTLVFTHHFGGKFRMAVDQDTIEVIDEINTSEPEAVIFEAGVDPTQMARVAHAIRGTPVMLVGETAGRLQCVRLTHWLGRREVACSRLASALRDVDVYVHWDAEPLMDRLMEPN